MPSPLMIENTGTVTAGTGTAIGFLTMNEWLALGTFGLGVVTFIVGRVYGMLERREKKRANKAELDRILVEIEHEKVELEMAKAKLAKIRGAEGASYD